MCHNTPYSQKNVRNVNNIGEVMKNAVILGTQWGDEGKGKIVDLLCEKYHAVVRFQGGNNAGHTIVIGNNTYKLRLIPSGIFHQKDCILGNGVVIDPAVFFEEIQTLANAGIFIEKNLHVSERAHVIMPYQKLWEAIEEEYRGKNKIGTTLKGIGPCYSDKISRNGIRIFDIIDKKRLQKRLETILPIKIKTIEAHGKKCNFTLESILEEYSNYGKLISPYVKDTSVLLENYNKENKKILFEGAQGTCLDIDHGIYPFVTSSNTCASAASIGSGVSLKKINKVIGITKAYTTRVGSGPFPTELHEEIGELLGKKGHEFGTVTGRKRRCGWFDIILLKYAHRINGLDSIVLTKLDVLSGINPIKICVGYKHKEQTLLDFPNNIDILEELTPIYEDMPGWEEDITSCKNFEDLPEQCKKYVEKIESILEVPIEWISVGPERTQTIKK